MKKFLVPVLRPITTNKYIIKDLLNFGTHVVNKDSSNFMGALDLNSLFTNICLETIVICTNKLFKNSDIIHGLKKLEFKDLLTLATKQTYFTFNNIHYYIYIICKIKTN